MTKATLKKRAQPFFEANSRPRTTHIKKPSTPAPVHASQQIAMLELSISMSKVFPLFNLQPSSTKAHTTDEGHLNTLYRIARHLRERAQQYAEIYLHFKETIGTNVDAKIAEHSNTFEQAIEAVKALPTKPSDPEVVHDVLRKMSAAAHALVFLQRDEITRLKNEAQRLKNPDQKEEVVARLQRLWRTNELKYDNPPGYHSISVGQWIEKNLVQSGLFTEEEINLIPTAVYRHVDRKLYQAIADARRKNSTVKSKKTEYNIEPSFKRPQPITA